jgi:uncharacterized membrane protein
LTILILGLVLFLGIHLVPALPQVKARFFDAFGEKRYKIIFSILSAIGLTLIVIGYIGATKGAMLFDPFPAAIVIAPFAMVISFFLLISTYMKTHIKAWIKHPMLLGIGIWSFVHLLANGHAKATVLFGAFLAYAVIDLLSAMQRRNFRQFTPVFKHDVIAAVLGVLLALLVMAFHRQLTGVPVVSWGV